MAGTNSTVEVELGGPAIILVRPQLAENIGAAARAMLNFGLDELRLIAPRDGWPNEAARAMASRADLVLDRATLYPSIEAGIADLQLILAATARPRDMAKRVLAPQEAAHLLREAMGRGESAGILFGAERSGLENDEVARAHAIVEVPANPAFASLNLAQAVLLVGYEWHLSGLAAAAGAGAQTPGETPPAEAKEFDYFFKRLVEELDRKTFFKPDDKRPSMLRNVRNMLVRSRFSEPELKTFHGIISALIRRDGGGRR